MKKTFLTLYFLGCVLLTWSQNNPAISISSKTLDYIKRAADGDHLALEGGHLALDGHVMPYPFFQNHEVLYLYRLSQLRHRKIWQADSVLHKPDWQADYPSKSGVDVGAKKVSANHLSGDRHTYDTYWIDLPVLPENQNGWERFFCLKPIEMSLPGWPETTVYINEKPKAALLRQHFYWSTDVLMDETKSNQICLKSFGIYDHPRGYREVSVVERDPLVEEFYWYMRVLIEASSILPTDSPGHQAIRSLADDMMSSLDLDLSGSTLFRTQLADILAQLKSRFESLKALAVDQPLLSMLIHGHLDSAWRWTLAHTDEKIERLVLNNLYLMDRYPEYKYIFTTPYHYERLAELYPALFARVQEKIQAGQWIANGSTYVETDMNLPGGESIVRQFLYGLDYYENTLGVTENTLFLPDTFGYPRFLPQVTQGFGLDHLIAMRVNTPEIDHTIYRWRGIDGSEILVNGLSTPAWEYPFVNAVHGYRIKNPSHYTTYNAPDPGPRRLIGTWKQFKDKSITNNQLLLIGWGDGGGGGTEDQIELIKKANSLPGTPKVAWSNLHDYIERQSTKKDAFPVFDQRIISSRWIQRTFLMANGIKTANRAAEQRLRETEALSAMAQRYGYTYPQEQLKTLWKQLLLHHFHDIITGMAVPEVLSEANVTINQIVEETKKLRDEAFDFLSTQMAMKKNGLLIFNPSGVTQNGVIRIINTEIPKQAILVNEVGKALPIAASDEDLLVTIKDLAPMSFRKLYWQAKGAQQPNNSLTASKQSLENNLVKIEFNSKGEISSYFDKEAKRELVPTGKSLNILISRLHKDGGSSSSVDAASFNPNERIASEAKFSKPYASALEASIQIDRSYMHSSINQTVRLNNNSKMLTFETAIDWKESTRLEVDFPMEFKTGRAHHGIQWGANEVSRANYGVNDSLHMPICVQQWADVSDEDYGIAIFDNVRYGYDLKKGGIRMILSYGHRKHGYSEIKNVTWNPTASGDLGGDHFSYAIYPHRGNLSDSDVIAKAKAFNTPLLSKSIKAQPGDAAIIPSLINNLPENIILQTIKKAEGCDGLIFRLYETKQMSTSFAMSVGDQSKDVFQTNMGEEIQNQLPLTDGQVSLEFSPFEIKTILLK